MSWKYKLGELVKAVGGKLNGKGDEEFSGISIDTRTIQKGNVFFALTGTKVDGHQFVQEAILKGAVAAVVSKDVTLPSIRVVDTLQAIQRFARWHRTNLKAQIFAITGSCGKTTSKELISSILTQKYKITVSKGNYNNELGCPLSLLQMNEDTDWGVIEMGAGKPGDIAELCAIAYPEESAITTIAPSHLERLGSIDGVAREKANIAKCLPPWGYFYVNTDDPYCVSIANHIIANKVYYGKNGDVALKSFQRISTEYIEAEIEPVGKLRLPLCSRSFLSNFLLAIAVSLKHSIPLEEKTLFDAYQRVGRIKTYQIGNFHIIDDCYNANPISMKSALEFLSFYAPESFRCAVLGDMLELGEDSNKYHYLLGKEAGNCGVNFLFIYGNYAKDVEKGAIEAGIKKIYICSSHKEIADSIIKILPPDSWLLIKGSRGMTMEKVI
ncbi:MAG TPA: UDP-N-acetylmuramoyl-tripeptide--D-alanyl-D-alanine ligase, partial [Candidatus Hydrogenedens sp.]|nr:UDP-N-acetylmuramoyl-tripeptide--D-alanyl-D-alanine ligase [Candidatus Hydrogenedens sp.]